MAWKVELDGEIHRTEQPLQDLKRKAKMLEFTVSLIDGVIMKPKSVEKK
jgi:hypothetical protein